MASSSPELIQEEKEHISQIATDWALGNGLLIRPPPALVNEDADPTKILATHAPVTLFPSRFPRQCFQQAKGVQKTYNTLYARIAQDEEFLARVVNEYDAYFL
jgi:glutathione synthase